MFALRCSSKNQYTVPIPDVKGKITFMKKGNARYVQLEIGRVYLPEKQYTIPQRVTIGKRDSENPDQMYPNEKYQDYFPDAVMPEERPEASVSSASCATVHAFAGNSFFLLLILS